MSVAWVGVAASVAGAAISASSSSKASKAQQQSSNDANALSREQFDKQIELQEPFRQTGLAANNRLAYLMGINNGNVGAPSGSPSMLTAGSDGVYAPGGNSSGVAPTTYVNGQTQDPVWENLLGDFNQRHASQFGAPMNRAWDSDADAQREYNQLAQQYRDITQKQAEEQAQTQSSAQTSADPNAPPPLDQTKGALLRTFSAEDLNADPVYQSGLKFGLDEGVKGIDRQAGATGSRLSGATLKALTRYGNDYGSTKANDAYNRFTNNQNLIYNKLAGVSGAGQQATNQVTNASQQYASTVGGNILGAGNSRAAGYIGAGNALNGGISSAVNGWQNNALMNKIFPDETSANSWRTTGNGMPSYYS